MIRRRSPGGDVITDAPSPAELHGSLVQAACLPKQLGTGSASLLDHGRANPVVSEVKRQRQTDRACANDDYRGGGFRLHVLTNQRNDSAVRSHASRGLNYDSLFHEVLYRLFVEARFHQNLDAMLAQPRRMTPN